MMQKKNSGVTLVEVLIALAVFLVLMVPLVSSLVTSTKTTDSAKTAQGRNEYAQVIMENIKNAPIEDLKDGTLVRNYLEGSENVSTTEDADHKGFTILGSTYIGTQHDKYSYKIRVDEVKRSDTYGIMEDMDPDKVAIVPVTFSNYDDVALDTIVAQSVTEKVSERLSASLEDANKSRIFNTEEDGTTVTYVDPRSIDPEKTLKTKKVLKSDTNTTKDLRLESLSVGRRINIEVSKQIDGYYVEYELSYVKIDSTKEPKDYEAYVTYKPYRKIFKNKPNVYVMYNAGVMNLGETDAADPDDRVLKDYITNDYFVFSDGVGLDKNINAFVIRTNNDYSKLAGISSELKADLTSALSDKIDTNNDGIPLYRKAGSASRNVTTYIYGDNANSYFKVYHNLFDGDTSLVSATDITVDALENAYEEVWYIYSVKIWMQQGEIANVQSIDNTDTKLVTLSGTRGGGEFE